MKRLALRKSASKKAKDQENPEFEKVFGPLITVARDPGSGGAPIAGLVAKQLNFRFYNESLVRDIAKSAHLRKSMLQQVDEKGRDLVTDFVHGLFNPEYVSDVTYMRHLCKIILSVAYKGKVVILGRGANFVVPSGACLRVRVTAPYRTRVKNAIEYEGHAREKAVEIVKSNEKDRREFVKQYFGRRISDIDYYDLVINTAFLSIDDSVELIKLAFQKKFPNV